MDFIKYKELESQIFGIKVGQVLVDREDTVKNLEVIMDNTEYGLLDLRVPYGLTRYIKDVQALNAIYVGSIVTYKLTVTPYNERWYQEKKVCCRIATSSDSDECLRITKESFIDPGDGINRFNLDSRFSNSMVEKYYTVWCQNCLNKSSADEVIVFDDGQIRGFISYKKIMDDTSSVDYNIPLNAVERGSRGKGVYRQMVDHVIKCIINLSLTHLSRHIDIRAYLGNLGLQKVWFDNGASIMNIEHVFHYGELK